MKNIIFAFLLLLPTFAMADIDPALQGKQAENFVRDLGNKAISTLEKTIGDDEARRDSFKTILNSDFDMTTIGRFAMGRYWTIATEEEKKQYMVLFRKMIIDVYTARFSDYSGQKFQVNGHKPAGRNDFLVTSQIVGSGQPIRVDWRVRKNRVIDVIVEGVSMSVTQRSEFASIIQRNGGQVESLIAHLQK